MKHLSPPVDKRYSPRWAKWLVVPLIVLHLVLLGAGAFCALNILNPNPTHHSHPAHPAHPAAPASILCAWACHVAQISSGMSPAAQGAALLLFLIFWVLNPLQAFPRILTLHNFSPRGPPVLSSVHG